MSSLQVAAGTVVGREHVRRGRNNQDGFAVRAEGEHLVAAVTDGCSSSRYAEVGSRFAAAFLVNEMLGRLRYGARADERLAESATDALVLSLDALARSLEGSTDDRLGIIADYLLFSFLAVAIDGERAVVFGVGDGVVSIDGRVLALDPGPSNAPDYLAYRLAANTSGAPLDVHHAGPLDALTTILIATDGLIDLDRAPSVFDAAPSIGGIAALEADRSLFVHGTRLHKRLAVLGTVERRLPDDTTVVLVRRAA